MPPPCRGKGLKSDFSKIFHPSQSITTPPNCNFLMKNQLRLPPTPLLFKNKNKIAENVIDFKAKLNTKWMELYSTIALKETLLISFEYYSKVSKQCLCSVSLTKPSTFTKPNMLLNFRKIRNVNIRKFN